MEKIKYNGYQVLILDENREKAMSLVEEMLNELDPDYQWQWRQNLPELVVEDVLNFIRSNDVTKMSDDEIRTKLRAILLYRGVNKWLFIRSMFIRLKKVFKTKMKKAEKVINSFENPPEAPNDVKKYYYNLGYYHAMSYARGVSKGLASFYRYVVWDRKKPVAVVSRKISRGYISLIKGLINEKFDPSQ